MAANPVQGAASALDRRGQISDGASGDFSALAGAADFALQAKGHGIVQRYGKNSVSIFPVANDLVEETFLLRWQKRAPIVGYGAAACRSFALFIPKQRVAQPPDIIPESASGGGFWLWVSLNFDCYCDD